MENEEVIEAEARIKRQDELRQTNDMSKAHDSVAAYAGVSQQPHLAYEDTPLLSRADGREPDPGNEDGGEGESAPAPAWTDDFVHLPWWQRPSVQIS